MKDCFKNNINSPCAKHWRKPKKLGFNFRDTVEYIFLNSYADYQWFVRKGIFPAIPNSRTKRKVLEEVFRYKQEYELMISSHSV